MVHTAVSMHPCRFTPPRSHIRQRLSSRCGSSDVCSTQGVLWKPPSLQHDLYIHSNHLHCGSCHTICDETGCCPLLPLLSAVQGDPGFPAVRWHGQHDGLNVLIMELLGPSLQSLLRACGGRFSLKTVVMLADEMLVRIQTIHSRGYVYGDVKPDNFVIGNPASSDPQRLSRVYAVDFGMSQPYWDFVEHRHLPFGSGESFRGTVRYCSLSSHRGVKPSRQDDLESLGYCLLYFLQGRLPWQGIQRADQSEKRRRVFRCKRDTPLHVLCEGAPYELQTYLSYCRRLRYEELPEYDYLRGLFTHIAEREHISYDDCYDWTPAKEAVGRERTGEEVRGHSGGSGATGRAAGGGGAARSDRGGASVAPFALGEDGVDDTPLDIPM